MSKFVEASVTVAVQRRRRQAKFVARGVRSLKAAQRSGDYVAPDAVMGALQRKLDAARTVALTRKPASRR